MKEYRTRREAEMEPELDLKYVWECDKCGNRMELGPQETATKCVCGGHFIKVGESYNA